MVFGQEDPDPYWEAAWAVPILSPLLENPVSKILHPVLVYLKMSWTMVNVVTNEFFFLFLIYFSLSQR